MLAVSFCQLCATDDQFIMKQIKAVEISSFEQIAPHYFEHITTALESKVCTVLCVVFT